MTEPISPDLPELRLFAQLAGVAPSRIVAAFNNPETFFDHLSLRELELLKESSDRLTALFMDLVAVANAVGSRGAADAD